MNKSVQVQFSELLPVIQDAINSGNTFTFTAFGNSMHPFIRGGKDRVTLSAPNSIPNLGDIVFYRRSNGEFVLHRIVHIKNDNLTLCGDNQFILEENIKPTQILAQFSTRERNGKILRDQSLIHQIWKQQLPIRRFFLHVASYLKRCIKNRIHF